MKKDQNQLTRKLEFLVYQTTLFVFNVYLFGKLASYAANFARTYSNLYSGTYNHVLMCLFFAGFFILLLNLTHLAKLIGEIATDKSIKVLKNVAITSVFVLIIVLLTQIIPEFFLTIRYDTQ